MKTRLATNNRVAAIGLLVLVALGVFIAVPVREAGAERVFCVANGTLTDCYSVPLSGESMYPTLQTGDVGIFSVTGWWNVYPHDIISFRWCGYTNLSSVHRVMHIGFDTQGWYAVTKGDNEQEYDPCKVRKQHLLGVLNDVVRY